MDALRAAAGLLLIAGSAPIQMQIALPTRDAADDFVQGVHGSASCRELDANDLLYQIGASRDYDPSAEPRQDPDAASCGSIQADDFINPPELGIAEREVKKSRTAASCCCPPPIKPTDTARTPGPPHGSNT